MEQLFDDRTHQVRANESSGALLDDSGLAAASPAGSCELSLSDSFLSQTDSIGQLPPRGLNRRSTTVESFRSGSSSPVSDSGQVSKHLRKLRTSSELREEGRQEKRRASLLHSTPNIYSPAGGHQGAVQTAVIMSQRGPKHKVIPCSAYNESCSEKQRLLSSPKHSNSFPVLKKFAISNSSYKSMMPSDLENMFNSVCHRKSEGMVFHTSQMLPPPTLVQSSSFLKYIGDRLKPSNKKSPDGPAVLRRYPEPNGRGAAPRYDKEIATSSSLNNGSFCEAELQENCIKGGSKALLIQKMLISW